MKLRILITGSTGFVGKTTVSYFQSKGMNDLYLLVRNTKKAEMLFSDCKIITTEDDDWMDSVAKLNPNIVLHLAAFFTGCHDGENINKLIAANIQFTTLLLEAISKTDCRHFINIGTFSEFRYGDGQYNPNNLYSATKTAQRPIIQYYQSISKWHWLNVVVYSPYGRKNTYKKVIDYMVDALDSKEPVAFTRCEQVLDFIHVDDMADFFYTLIQKIDQLNQSYYQFYLGTGKGYSLKDVANKIENIFGKRINANFGGRDYSDQDIMYSVAPIEQNISVLNWRSSIDIDKGLNLFKMDLYE